MCEQRVVVVCAIFCHQNIMRLEKVTEKCPERPINKGFRNTNTNPILQRKERGKSELKEQREKKRHEFQKITLSIFLVLVFCNIISSCRCSLLMERNKEKERERDWDRQIDRGSEKARDSKHTAEHGFLAPSGSNLMMIDAESGKWAELSLSLSP